MKSLELHSSAAEPQVTIMFKTLTRDSVPLPAGFGGQQCKKCEKGTFGVGGSTQPCQFCGPSQTSPAGAPSRDFCQVSIKLHVAARRARLSDNLESPMGIHQIRTWMSHLSTER
jgi:hypothetical protein